MIDRLLDSFLSSLLISLVMSAIALNGGENPESGIRVLVFGFPATFLITHFWRLNNED